MRLRKVGSLAQDSGPPPPTCLSFQQPLALRLAWSPGCWSPTGTFLPLKARPPALLLSSPQASLSRGTQFPFDLFKAGARCATPVRSDPFLLVTEARKTDQPHFSSLASGGLARAVQCHLSCLICVRPFVKILPPAPHQGGGQLHGKTAPASVSWPSRRGRTGCRGLSAGASEELNGCWGPAFESHTCAGRRRFHG